MLIDKALYHEVDRIVHGYYHECPFRVETWAQRIEHLDFFVDDDATSILRCCAQVADAADAAATLTGRTPFGDHKPWRGKVDDAIKLPPDERGNFHAILLNCAQRADALESFWRAVTPRAATMAI